METANNPKSGDILIWNGYQWECKNILSDIKLERLRKERKEKLEKINALQYIIQ
jgi:hypothetical protein